MTKIQNHLFSASTFQIQYNEPFDPTYLIIKLKGYS